MVDKPSIGVGRRAAAEASEDDMARGYETMAAAPGWMCSDSSPSKAVSVSRAASRFVAALAGAFVVAVAAPAAGAPVGTVTEFPLVAGSDPYGITAGPDGNLWFTNLSAGYIGRITPAGTLTQFSAGISPGSPLRGIVTGPDGNLWFTDDVGTIGRITPTGTVTDFAVPGSDPYEIALGPDGNLWFTEFDYRRIRRMTPTGTVTDFSAGINGSSRLYDIVAGPDGNLWFTELRGDRIGRITPAGTVTEFAVTPGSRPYGIALGADGNLWYTQRGADRIGRMTPTGTVTDFSAGITPGSVPLDIAAGPDGNLWFTELDGDRIGRITPTGTVTEFPVITANSEPYGIVAGSDGDLWFTERAAGRIGRITATAAPDAPTAVTAMAGNGQAAVSWSAPASDGHAAIASYTASASGAGGQSCTWTSGPLTCTLTGLTNGTSYTFTVAATNSAGASPASAPSNPVTPSAPASPTPTPTTAPPAPTPTPTPIVAAPLDPVILAPTLPSYTALLAGLKRVTAVKVGSASVAFTQHAAAAGRLRWTLDLSFYITSKKDAKKRSNVRVHKPVRKPTQVAASSRAITMAETVRGRLELGAIARKLLKRHPAARLVLRTTLTLDNRSVIRATKTLSRQHVARAATTE
jgi:streptogramin lyase